MRQEIGGMATYNDTGAYFHHRDWLGNLRVITDQAGTVKQTCTNLPYGDALNCTANGITPLAFTGYMRDSETNLDFANARYYSSQFGQFMSPDPLGGDVTDPQSLNRYAYVTNSPLSAIDPSGMDGCAVVDGFANCVLTFSGAGSGGDAGFGGGPFDAGGSNGGEVTLDICRYVDCGLGGGSGLPGPPSFAGLTAEQSFFSDPYIRDPFAFLKGAGEEITVNAFIGFMTLVDRMTLLSHPKWYRSTHPERYLIKPKNFSEQVGMFFGGMAGFLIPGGGEETGAAVVERIFADPKILAEFNTEFHAAELGKLLETEGWQVTRLGQGAHKGLGMRAVECAGGSQTDRMIMWHPGGGHHGSLPYWKVSSAQGGTVRIGPQFLP